MATDDSFVVDGADYSDYAADASKANRAAARAAMQTPVQPPPGKGGAAAAIFDSPVFDSPGAGPGSSPLPPPAGEGGREKNAMMALLHESDHPTPGVVSYPPRELRVTVLAARGLPRLIMTGRNRPFVMVGVAGETQRTNAVTEGDAQGAGTDCEWGGFGEDAVGEALKFELEPDVKKLQVWCFDEPTEDEDREDTLIGIGVLPTFTKDGTQPRECGWAVQLWATLRDSTGKPAAGKVLLLLQCWDPELEAPPPEFDPTDRRTNWEDAPRKLVGEKAKKERISLEREGCNLIEQKEYGFFGAPDYPGVLSLLQGSDRRFYLNEVVMARGCAAIQHMAINSALWRQKIGEAGGIEVIEATIKRMEWSSRVQEKGFYALYALSMHDPEETLLCGEENRGRMDKLKCLERAEFAISGGVVPLTTRVELLAVGGAGLPGVEGCDHKNIEPHTHFDDLGARAYARVFAHRFTQTEDEAMAEASGQRLELYMEPAEKKKKKKKGAKVKKGEGKKGEAKTGKKKKGSKADRLPDVGARPAGSRGALASRGSSRGGSRGGSRGSADGARIKEKRGATATGNLMSMSATSGLPPLDPVRAITAPPKGFGEAEDDAISVGAWDVGATGQDHFPRPGSSPGSEHGSSTSSSSNEN